ncbi:MFS transporter [Nitrospira sp.]|nr:MFS transporter [Nitrospira sp.]
MSEGQVIAGGAGSEPGLGTFRARVTNMLPPGWELIRTRNFGLLFWGQLTSQIGDSLSKVALLWFVYQLTGSALKMAMIGLLQTVPPLLLGPIMGVYLDRLPKKATMVGVDIARFVLVALIPTLYSLDLLTLEGLYCLVFLNAIVSMIFGPALASAVPMIVNRTQLTSANAWLQGTANAGVLIGPIISGIGIATIGAQNVLYVDAVTFLISALCLMPMRVREVDWADRTETPRGSFLQELSVGFRFVFNRDRTIFSLMLTATLYSLGVSAFVFMLPVFAERSLAVGPLELGWLWSGLGMGMLLTSAWLASKGQHDLFSRFRMVAGAMSLGGLSVCLLSTLQTPLLAIALIVVIGACTAVFMPIVWGVLQEVTPEPLLGRVFTTFSTGGMASSMAGMAGFGWAADAMGPSVSLIGIGLVLFGTAFFAARCSRTSVVAR